jgi:branched-chain amino acid transport system ATP-binding protein
MTLLEAAGLTKFYGSFCALDGVTLAIPDGQFVSIIGPNGAGKTTLVNVLTGSLAPTRGTVRFKGKDVAGLDPVRLAGRGLARSFQLVNVFPGLTVAETLAVALLARAGRGAHLWASLADQRAVWNEAAGVAELFGLAGSLGRPARTLPQGDKKLLDVASAFALRPEVILLDEPTSGVSTADKHAVMGVLVEAARRLGITSIIQVEHDMDIVFGYSDRIVALHQGRVIADGTPAAIRANDQVMGTVAGRAVRSVAPAEPPPSPASRPPLPP